MVDPVHNSIIGQWGLRIDEMFLGMEEDTEAYPYKSRMSGIKSNVIARDISDRFREPVRHQEFLDGEMRESHGPNPLPMSVTDQGDQIRARRHDCFFLILPAVPPVWIYLRDPFRVGRVKVQFQNF